MTLMAAALALGLPRPICAPFPLSDVRLLGGPFEAEHRATAKYLLDLDPERLLAGFRANSGLETSSRIYGGWETGGLAGHSIGHYLTACSQEYARTGDRRYRAKVEMVVKGLAQCQKARGDGLLTAFRFERGFDRVRLDRIWAEVAKGEIRTGGFDLNGMWSPWYVHHKVLAGLLDAHKLCSNPEALEAARRFADWALEETKGFTEDQWQKMLACEYGGMSESLADLYSETREGKYLELARKFYDRRVLDPLAIGKDELAGKHSNTQIPKLIGLARLYELTGEPRDRKAAAFFWEAVVGHHTYAIGGNSNGEYLGPPDRLAERLSSNTCETCNTYNMLKLTRHLFGWNPQARLMDFYEQATFNHILASQDPDTAGVTYFMPLASGSHRTYSGRFDNFTCCHGTGMENHIKHADSAYFHDGAKTLWVNLFMPTELSWREAKTRIRQETDFPAGGKVMLVIEEGGGAFNVKVRHPGWAAGRVDFRVNGIAVTTSAEPASYATIRRRWKKGDRLEFTLPMPLREIPMPDNPDRVALACGPIVLAADLGPAEGPAPRVPVLVTNGRKLESWLRPAGAPLEFETDAGRPTSLRFSPFYLHRHDRYAVYFDKFTQAQWDKSEADYRAEEARRRDLEARTIDQVTVGEMQPERDHNLKSERNDVRGVNGRSFRTAMAGGWIEVDLKIDADRPNELLVTYWGNDRLRPDFELMASGVTIASERLEKRPQNVFFDVRYSLPESLTKGKRTIRLRIQPAPGKSGPSIAGIRTVRTGS